MVISFGYLASVPLLIPNILLGGLLGGLLSEGSTPQRPTVSGGKARSALGPRLLQWLLMGALIGLGSGLINGLAFGLSVGICCIRLQCLLLKNSTAEAAHSQASSSARGTAWQSLIRRREVHNGLLVGLLIGLSYGLLFGLSAGLLAALLAGPSAGLLVGLLKGDLASFRHYVVRFLLWRAGSIPWNYPRFLDYAAERTLLSKVGGGYIFVHRLLLEYFASLDDALTLVEAKVQEQRVLPVS